MLRENRGEKERGRERCSHKICMSRSISHVLSTRVHLRTVLNLNSLSLCPDRLYFFFFLNQNWASVSGWHYIVTKLLRALHDPSLEAPGSWSTGLTQQLGTGSEDPATNWNFRPGRQGPISLLSRKHQGAHRKLHSPYADPHNTVLSHGPCVAGPDVWDITLAFDFAPLKGGGLWIRVGHGGGGAYGSHPWFT